jgi:protein TonB
MPIFSGLLLSVVIHILVIIYFLNNSNTSHATPAEDQGQYGVSVGIGHTGSYLKVKPIQNLEVTPALVSNTTLKKQPIKVEPIINKKTKINTQSKKLEVIKPEKSIDRTSDILVKDIKYSDSQNEEKVYQQQLSKATGEANDNNTGGSNTSIPPNYLSKIKFKLQSYKYYPKKAKKNKQQGVVFLQFTVNRKGKVISKSVKASAGHQILDSAALKILEEANPFPKFTKDMLNEVLTITIPVEYSLINQ